MDSHKPPASSDEIDISQIFRSIGIGFRALGQSLLIGIASLRRQFLDNVIFFVIVIISGLTLTGIYSKIVEKKYYTSSMIISCSYLNMRIVASSMEKLNLLCQEADREGLTEVLRINSSTALNIKRFDVESFVSEQDRVEIEVLKEQLSTFAVDKKGLIAKMLGKLDTANVQIFKVNVSVFNPEVVQTLDSALVRYFRDNEYVGKRIDTYRQSIISRKAKLVAESKKLDSLKSVLYANFQTMSKQSREGSNNVILSDKYLTDPMNVFKEDLNLNNEIRKIDERLAIRPDFEVVDGLTTFREPENLNLPILLIISGLISIVVGYIFIGLWKFNKYLSTLG